MSSWVRPGRPSRDARAHLREARRVAWGPLGATTFLHHQANGGTLTKAQFDEAVQTEASYAEAEAASKVKQAEQGGGEDEVGVEELTALMQGLGAEEKKVLEAAFEHDARMEGSGVEERPVVMCRMHRMRRLTCEQCASPCVCGLGLGWSCVVCTPRLLCDCGGGKLLASCSNCNAGAFCDCGTVEAPRWRHNCPKHNPDAFCTHGVEGVPRRRSSCPTCNPQLLCGCGTVEAPRRRADCPTHRKRPKKATVAAGAPSAKRQRTLIGGNQSLPYKEARAWVHTQGCGGKGDKFKKWQALKKKLKARGEWPNNIPSTPDQHYNEGRGWLPKGGWKDWCGE